MIIQFITDKNISVHNEYETQITTKLTKDLERFSEHLSKVLVHLSDENGSKAGLNDKKCMLEARFEGKQPILVSDLGDTYDLALKSATEKLKHALTSVVGKLQER